MTDHQRPIYVSRKGTAGTSIDADPAFRVIYEARRRNRALWYRIFARVIVVVGVLGLFALVYHAIRR